MNKKILIFILMIAMFVSVFAITTFADENEESSNYSLTRFLLGKPYCLTDISQYQKNSRLVFEDQNGVPTAYFTIYDTTIDFTIPGVLYWGIDYIDGVLYAFGSTYEDSINGDFTSITREIKVTDILTWGGYIGAYDSDDLAYNQFLNAFSVYTYENDSSVPESTVGHYQGATLNIYNYSDPYNGDVLWSGTWEPDSYKNIFSFLDLQYFYNNYFDDWTGEIYIEFVFPSGVDFVTNPISFYDSRSDEFYQPITDFLTIYYGNDYEKQFTTGKFLYSDNSYYYYLPSSSSYYNVLGFSIIDYSALAAYLYSSTDSESLESLCLTNRSMIGFTLDVDMMNEFYNYAYEEGKASAQKYYYDSGFDNGRDYGYDQGYRDAMREKGADFYSLFDGIANVPITVLSSLLGFELFGVNILSVLLGVLTSVVLVFIIKKFI